MYLTQTLHRAVQQDPDRVLTVTGQRTRSVAESAARVARLAGGLRELGVGSGDRVAMMSLNSDRYHEYLLAVPWADAVLNPVNVRWNTAEVAFALRESGTRVLLADEVFTEQAAQLKTECPELETLICCTDGGCPEGFVDFEELVAGADPVEDARRGGEALFGIFYTGGTTGRPKGAMLSHQNMMVSALGSQAMECFISPGGRLLHVAPMFHLADIAIWLSGMMAGSTHVTLPGFDPQNVLETMQEQRITDALVVPTMIQMMVAHAEAATYDLSTVRRLLYGTSPISESLLDAARSMFPSASFTQAYGMTELAPVATILAPADHDHPQRRRSGGRAAPHAEVRIVDSTDREVSRGTVGEIVVRGDNVMLGYWERDAETAEALRNGWMHTGDVGYMDGDGYVYVVDRLKDMIITGGENVYSAEVENVLSRHPAVAACAVIGVPDTRWGERVHAVVVLRDGHAADTEELRDHCRSQLAGYKTPRTVEFVDQLPLSAAGKILKRELRRRHQDTASPPVS